MNKSIWVPGDVQKNPKNSWINGEQCRPKSDAAFCGVWSGSALFAQVVCLDEYLGL